MTEGHGMPSRLAGFATWPQMIQSGFFKCTRRQSLGWHFHLSSQQTDTHFASLSVAYMYFQLWGCISFFYSHEFFLTLVFSVAFHLCKTGERSWPIKSCCEPAYSVLTPEQKQASMPGHLYKENKSCSYASSGQQQWAHLREVCSDRGAPPLTDRALGAVE